MESEKIQATIFVFYVFRTSWLHGMNLFFVQYRASYVEIHKQPKALARTIEQAIWSTLFFAISIFFLVKFIVLAMQLSN